MFICFSRNISYYQFWNNNINIIIESVIYFLVRILWIEISKRQNSSETEICNNITNVTFGIKKRLEKKVSFLNNCINLLKNISSNEGEMKW